MDYTPLTSQLLSLACHCILIGWVYWDYMAEPIVETDETSSAHIAEDADTKTEQDAPALGKIIAAPALAIAQHSQNVEAFAALPLQQIDDFNDDATFTAAIKNSYTASINIDETLTGQGDRDITLPQTPLTLTQHQAFSQADHKSEQVDLKQRRNDLNQFAYTMSIIIGSHYYQRHWKKKIAKSISNFDLKLLITTQNSRIVAAEFLRGSGVQIFDESLLRWIAAEKPGGPPLADGQYPIVIKLK